MPTEYTPEIRVCHNCGVLFPVFRAFRAFAKINPAIYCSRECDQIARRAKRAANMPTLFWSRVNKTEGCWLWTHRLTVQGYGEMSIAGKHPFAHRIAYELTYGTIPPGLFVLHRCDNPPCVRPDHLFLGTRGDNNRDAMRKGRAATGDRHGSKTKPNRVARGDRNGARLHPETRARGDANSSRKHPERLARGDTHYARTSPERLARGDTHGQSKLNAEQVREIRQRYAAGGISTVKLAAEFGVAKSTILGIIHRRIWNHIE